MSETDNRSQLLAKLRLHAKKVDDDKRFCTNEANTRRFLVEPLLDALGYDCSNPRDVRLEFTADIAGKKGEKVDYALMRDAEPVVLVEAKSLGNNLGGAERHQLQRYFPFTRARLAVLTNGVQWQWFKGMSEPGRSHEMESSPFLTYDARKPSEASAEWLSQLTKDEFNPEELLRISRRNDFSDKISDWIHRTLVDPSDNAATEIRMAVGLDASSQETPLVVDAIRSAWDRVVGGQETPAPEESDTADELANPSDAHQSTDAPTDTVTSASRLRFDSLESDQLDIDDGETLSRFKKRRAWKIDGEEWQIEDSGTRLTATVLGLMLECDSRRDDAEALADEFGLRTSNEPLPWHWELVPGFSNLYFNKDITAEQKRDFLARVADNLMFDPPEDHPLGKSGKIEWWLPRLNR